MAKGRVCGIKRLRVENMQDNAKHEIKVGSMKKRRETMEDGRRYIIYYTFDEAARETVKVDIEREEERTGESNV